MAASRHLGFDRTRNSAVQSAVPKNPTLEPNTTLIGLPITEISQFEISKMAAILDFLGFGGQRSDFFYFL